ncbi:uncharacterized protein LOC134186295 [Corticium candelabrum]|uniref:uncharacterized protein LOC134186295 n=1 Tax=Corticium candelabrum TaxID=121492 RepID=UPI002E2555B9|nr:uncharacterized protein LOC134186295 [Corticium candelabrum]
MAEQITGITVTSKRLEQWFNDEVSLTCTPVKEKTTQNLTERPHLNPIWKFLTSRVKSQKNKESLCHGLTVEVCFAVHMMLQVSLSVTLVQIRHHLYSYLITRVQ